MNTFMLIDHRDKNPVVIADNIFMKAALENAKEYIAKGGCPDHLFIREYDGDGYLNDIHSVNDLLIKA